MAPAKSARLPKVPDLMPLVHGHLAAGSYVLTIHGKQREAERATIQEIEEALRDGHWDKSNDRFDDLEGWSYAVKGKTHGGRRLRVVIAFEESMLIVTVRDLDQEARNE